jgi:hypothetical protein
MGEIQKLYVSLALKSAEFTQGLKEVGNKANGFAANLRGRVGGSLRSVARIGSAAFLGVGMAAVGGFGLAMRSAIDMNSQLETSTLQFQTLMGDADLAAEHVGKLFEFAGKTPFETQPIIDASLKLQTYGGAALNTMENLQLVGDAAAAVGQPIDEVAFWVGRAYAAMQAGQPFGEAAMRLQEMGIMGPEARQALEDLQASGASGAEVFGLFTEQLGGFSGAMELQAGTWQGLTSTIKDNLNLLVAGALKPFFDLAKEGLAGLAEWLQSAEVQAAIQSFAEKLTLVVTAIATFVSEQVVPFVQEHGPQLQEVLTALAIAFGALMIIGAVSALLSLFLSPIGLIAAAVGLLAAAWVNNWGGIRDETGEAWERIKVVFEALKMWFNQTLMPIVRLFAYKWQENWELSKTILTNVWTVIEAIFKEVGRWIKDNLGPWVKYFHDKWTGEWWPAIERALKLAWEKVIRPVLGYVWDKFKDVMGGIEEAIAPAKRIWDGFIDAVKGFWDWISNKVFNFQIDLPDLPDWATPGSPLPIHTAWVAFAQDAARIGKSLSFIGAGLEVGLSRRLEQALDGGGPGAMQQSVYIYGGYNVQGTGDGRDALSDLYYQRL